MKADDLEKAGDLCEDWHRARDLLELLSMGQPYMVRIRPSRDGDYAPIERDLDIVPGRAGGSPAHDAIIAELRRRIQEIEAEAKAIGLEMT